MLREKVARAKIVSRLANVPPCLIGIEAGMGTHYVTRELRALDHDVRQVPPVYAKPFRQTHKNDFRDAHAVAEAVQRPTTRCVPPKTDEQLDLQALHRVRYRLVGQRTAIINQIRCFLLAHHGEAAAALVAPRIAGHPCPTHRRPVTADGSHPRGPDSRLAPPSTIASRL